MGQIISLIKPRLLSFKNRSRIGTARSRRIKYLTLGLIGLIFWSGIFAITMKVLEYFKGIPGIGDILIYKMLSMALITFFSLLIYSGVLTFLSKLYLSRDLPLVHSLPVQSHKIFLARWIESTFDSSWMVMIYSLPIFLSYGIAFSAGPYYYFAAGVVMLSISTIASAIGALLVIIIVIIVPANRIKSIFVFIGLIFFVMLYVAVRVLKPERLVDPEAFDTVLLYIRNLETPSSVFLPSTWALDGLKAALNGSIVESMFHVGIAASCAAFAVMLIILLADALYFTGYSKTQSAPIRLLKYANMKTPWFLKPLSGPVRAFAVKEIRTFHRDQTQWTQIFLICALVFIYLYNFKVLPLDKAPIEKVVLQNILSFLNMGLAVLVLSAITARFAYPAVSIERNAFWVVKSGPISLKTFLWVKFFIYFVPMLIMTEVLIIATNLMLNVTPLMMWLSTITVFCMVPGVVAMGIGFGAAYPDFKSENPAQAVTGFGGLLFMMLCVCFIGVVVILEAGPVYALFTSGYRNRAISTVEWIWFIGAFSAVFALCIAAIFVPMKYGEKNLRKQFT